MAGIHATGVSSSSPPSIGANTGIDPANLTFGIELEFMLIHPDDCFASLQLDGMTNAVKAINNLLNAGGVPTKCFYDPPDNASLFSTWAIDNDAHMLTKAEAEHRPPDYTVAAIEISSRKMKFYDPGWHKVVSAVLDIINRLTSEFGCLVLVNQNCGFHVHIGFDNQIVPVDTCKNVFQVATALERCFDQLHTASRIMPGEGSSYGSAAHFNAPLSWFHTHAARAAIPGDQPQPSVFDWLRRIEDCETHRDIDKMFNIEWPSAKRPRRIHSHFSVLNFGNCVEEAFSQAKGTIEFRQHEGTLDHADICAWVKLTARLVRFCNNADPRDILSLCGHAWNPDFGISDLMQRIGCAPDHIGYYQERHSPISHASFLGDAASDRAKLEAGGFTGIDAMWMQNGIDNFKRRSPHEVNTASAWKLNSGAQGRIMRFDSVALAECLTMYDAAAAQVASGRRKISNAKKIAFSWMEYE